MNELDNNQLLYAILIIQIIGDQTITKARVKSSAEKADQIINFLNELQDAEPTT